MLISYQYNIMIQNTKMIGRICFSNLWRWSKPLCRTVTTTNTDKCPHVAIVGSGPAGYYTAQQVLKGHPSCNVDIYEKLPVPFGLVRFGVAPDHPDVKNVINTFTKTAINERCGFFGNVTIGKDLSVDDLRKHYTAVVLAYGAEEDKSLHISGEDLNGVLSARSFVGWYNGLPEDANLQPCLDTDCAVILGQGNVAIDVARILLTPVDILRKFDVPEYALETLSQSRIRKVHLVGRRGPLQVAFTTAELREMVRLEGCKPVLNQADFSGLTHLVKDVPQKRRRLTQLLFKTALDPPSEEEAARWQTASREWSLVFLRSPQQILPDAEGKKVAAVEFIHNKLEGEKLESQKAVPSKDVEKISCGLVLRSIGYRSLPLPGVPFDDKNSIVPNTNGLVSNSPGVYCSGWVKRGPVGVIVSTMTDAFETGKAIVKDLTSGALSSTSSCEGKDAVLPILRAKGVQVVTFEDWMKIDQTEIDAGKRLCKSREKIVDVLKMLELAK